MTQSSSSLRTTADLIRKGAVLLKETCPRCGSLQLSYKDRILCTVCTDLSAVEKEAPQSQLDTILALRDLVLGKIRYTAEQLSKETDTDNQNSMATLLLKYIEIIDRISERVAKEKKTSR